ncbi:MAG: cyclic nucleotide-binding domain-containing protein [Deltaproteobacteria bacterium]|nr:cyclic nucleotide-binding domain-containing protein [Deltaproteobacteria bacterium]
MASDAVIGAVKDRAESLFAKGRYREAIEAYEKIMPYGAKDPRIFLRLGDIARKAADARLAVGYYNEAAESFTKLGFIVKAIAVCKLIMNIDPAREDIQEKLAGLYKGQSNAEPPRHDGGVRVPRTPLFSDFTEEEFLAVVRKVRSRELPPGEYLFREGDSGDSIYMVAEGAVEVIGRAKDSASVRLASLGDGAVFGEFGFFLNSKRTTDVKGSARSTVLELTKEDLDGIISRHKRVEDVLFGFYKERVLDRFMALSELFRSLDNDERKEALKRVTLVKFEKGSVIVKEGDRGDTMYLIKSGRASVSIGGKEGAVPIAELGEGDLFGEIGLATTRPRTATVRAATDIELAAFSRAVIRDVITKHPEAKGALEKVIKERVSDLLKFRGGAEVCV